MEINKILSLSKGDFGINQVANLSPSEIAAMMYQASKLSTPDDLSEEERNSWMSLIKSSMINILTYAELKSKISESKLNQGAFYVISDYSTKIKSEVKNAELKLNPVSFKIMVQALSNSRISKSAKIVDGPTGSEGWEVMYDIDPKLCSWAADDSTGVIYWMRDENGNEAPFDFKSILFKRYRVAKSANTIASLLECVPNTPIRTLYKMKDYQYVRDILSEQMCGIKNLTFNYELKLSEESDYFSAIGPESVRCKIISSNTTVPKEIPNIVIEKGINSTISGDTSTYKHIINSETELTKSYVGVQLLNSVIYGSDQVHLVGYNGPRISGVTRLSLLDGLTIGTGCRNVNILCSVASAVTEPSSGVTIEDNCHNILVGNGVKSVKIGGLSNEIMIRSNVKNINIGRNCFDIDLGGLTNNVDIGSESVGIILRNASGIQINSLCRSLNLGSITNSRFGCSCEGISVNCRVAKDVSYIRPDDEYTQGVTKNIEAMSKVSSVTIMGRVRDILFGPGVSSKNLKPAGDEFISGKQFWE